MTPILALIGILGGLLWLGLALFRPDWGPPGTPQYGSYELWNRLWTPALLGMGAGFGALFRQLRPALSRQAQGSFLGLLSGCALMVLGNVGEFWIFTDQPYEGEGSLIRLVSWLTYLFGALLMLSATVVAGVVLWRSAHLPRGLLLLFRMALPLSIAVMFLNMELAVQVPSIGGLSLLVGTFVLRLSFRPGAGCRGGVDACCGRGRPAPQCQSPSLEVGDHVVAEDPAVAARLVRTGDASLYVDQFPTRAPQVRE